MAVRRVLAVLGCFATGLLHNCAVAADDKVEVSDDNGDSAGSSSDDNSEKAQELVVQTARMFQQAVRSGDVKAVVAVMKSFAAGNSPDTLAKVLNWQDKVGASSLHWCAFYGTEVHVALSKTFLHVAGVDSSILDNQNRTACHTACARGAVGVLENILDPEKKAESTCDPLTLDGVGLNCVHYAARRNDVKMLDVLAPLITKENVDAYTKASSGAPETALFIAVEEGSAEAVEALIKLGASGAKGRLVDEGKVEEKASSLANDKLVAYTTIASTLRDASGKDSKNRGAEL